MRAPVPACLLAGATLALAGCRASPSSAAWTEASPWEYHFRDGRLVGVSRCLARRPSKLPDLQLPDTIEADPAAEGM